MKKPRCQKTQGPTTLSVPATKDEHERLCQLVKEAVTCRPIRQISELHPSEGIDCSEALVGEVMAKISANGFRILRMHRGGNVTSYFRAIAINMVRDKVRAAASRIDHRSVSLDLMVENGVPVEPLSSAGMADADASEVLQEREAARDLAIAIAEVPNSLHRTILSTALIHERAPDQVAKSMGISRNTVYLVISRFRKERRRFRTQSEGRET